MIPKAVLKRILKDAGAERVSADALEQLNDEVMQYASSIALDSVKLAEHAGRKTIKSSDIALAV